MNQQHLLSTMKRFSGEFIRHSSGKIATKLNQLAWKWRGALIVIPGVAGVTIAIKFLGLLQPVELAALDVGFRWRPIEPVDERIVVVSIEESDLARLKQWPFSDEILSKLISEIKKQHPSAIGLDLYRNLPVEPGHDRLAKLYKTTPNLIGIQKALGDKYSPAIPPPPILAKLKQVSANDLVVDSDGVVRRVVLFPMPKGNEGLPNLGLAMAMFYLKQKGITATSDPRGFLQLGKTVFVPFEANDGGYVRADAGGYQILLNFRGPSRSFVNVSITDVLEKRVKRDLMRDRIVLIGAKANSLNDNFYTPYSSGFSSSPVRTSGVELQANIASQILSSVLNDRPLIQVWPNLLENLWIVVWASLIPVFGWKWRHHKANLFLLQVGIILSLSSASLLLFAYLAFLIGWWIPVVPPLLAMLASTVAIGGYVYVSRLQELNAVQEQIVKNLEQALLDLQRSQLQLIQSEKMSALGQLVSGVAHEINNPVSFVSGNLQHVQQYVQESIEHLKLYQKNFPQPGDEITENACKIELEYILEDLPELLESMQVGINRIKDISVSLRTFSRSDAVNKVTCNIHDGIDSTLMILNARLKANKNRPEIKVIKSYDRLPQLNCYLGQLNQVIMNLLSNAIDALDESNAGRSFVDIVANPNTITIRTEILEENGMVAIRIKDNGSGIPEEFQPKIFDQLFTTKGVGKGTGLGLSISRQIVEEMHKGKLKCISSPGKGAEFIIEIPTQ